MRIRYKLYISTLFRPHVLSVVAVLHLLQVGIIFSIGGGVIMHDGRDRCLYVVIFNAPCVYVVGFVWCLGADSRRFNDGLFYYIFYYSSRPQLQVSLSYLLP